MFAITLLGNGFFSFPERFHLHCVPFVFHKPAPKCLQTRFLYVYSLLLKCSLSYVCVFLIFPGTLHHNSGVSPFKIIIKKALSREMELHSFEYISKGSRVVWRLPECLRTLFSRTMDATSCRICQSFSVVVCDVGTIVDFKAYCCSYISIFCSQMQNGSSLWIQCWSIEYQICLLLRI